MKLADFSPSRWRERQRERDADDFADMGTAFGLDASFALEAMNRPVADGPPGAVSDGPPGAVVDAAPASGAPRAATRRWWSRRGDA